MSVTATMDSAAADIAALAAPPMTGITPHLNLSAPARPRRSTRRPSEPAKRSACPPTTASG